MYCCYCCCCCTPSAYLTVQAFIFFSIRIGRIYLLCSFRCDRGYLSWIKCCTFKTLIWNTAYTLCGCIDYVNFYLRLTEWMASKRTCAVILDLSTRAVCECVFKFVCHLNKCSIPFQHSNWKLIRRKDFEMPYILPALVQWWSCYNMCNGFGVLPCTRTHTYTL